MRGFSWAASDDGNSPSTSGAPSIAQAVSGHSSVLPSGTNVLKLLSRREVCPRSRRSSKKFWGEPLKPHIHPHQQKCEIMRDARRGLISWVEAESLRYLSAKYCPLLPPPRSTIAAAFSPDGKILASTHGDHTVKLIDSETGSCLKVLSGHRRTPWVVRFHPLHPEILASGSLDHEVRLWDAATAECIASRDFCNFRSDDPLLCNPVYLVDSSDPLFSVSDRPIASIAFHAQGELLAVASGHRLYMWHYNRRGETSSPTVILKPRRSLRAVHFHPHGAPFLLTAEVNDLDCTDSSMTIATSPGYLQYPPPTVYFADVHSHDRTKLADELHLMPLPLLMWPNFFRDEGRVSLQQIEGDVGLISGQQRLVDPAASVRLLTYSTPSGQYELLLSPIEAGSSTTMRGDTETNQQSSVMDAESGQPAVEMTEAMEMQPEGRDTQVFSFSDPRLWELPFLHGWVVNQTQAGSRFVRLPIGGALETPSAFGEVGNSAAVPSSADVSQLGGRSASRHRSMGDRVPAAGVGDIAIDESDPQSIVSKLRSDLAASLAAAASTELPCTVKLRIWPHDVKDPCAQLDSKSCRLTIPHAVLCSEMGAHFSPCGRFLAACVACVLPQSESDPGLHSQISNDAAGVATSPTRHPISSHQIIYELRIYSLEEATFGMVLASRPIRAAHCLTSIQFSPTSEHLLLAYGRRHSSLLKSIVIDGENTAPIYTILEIYRVSNIELVRVLPNAEDEVNVACFHPSVGGGLVYGTKEGKLRILQYDRSRGLNLKPSAFLDDIMPENASSNDDEDMLVTCNAWGLKELKFFVFWLSQMWAIYHFYVDTIEFLSDSRHDYAVGQQEVATLRRRRER